MARHTTESGSAWVQSLGEALGAQLGLAIAESMQRTLQASIDVGSIAASLGAGGGAVARTGRRGRPPASGAKAICKEPGCGKPVLAKGICRSHYYKLRYKMQKTGSLVPKARGSKKKAEKADKADKASDAKK